MEIGGLTKLATYYYYFIFALLISKNSVKSDYCQIQSCVERSLVHTACLYKKDKPANKCKTVLAVGISAKERAEIVDFHNEIRQKVARGEEQRADVENLPAAKHMPNLTWDEELAFLAQRWAYQCTLGEDSCRDVERFRVGQNYGFYGSASYNETLNPLTVIRVWYHRGQIFHNEDVSCYRKKGDQNDRYTRIIWANTTKIGCGAIKFKNSRLNMIHLFCNYAPLGNLISRPIYETSNSTNKPSDKCTGYRQSGLTHDEKKQILDLHNYSRQKVARGEEDRGSPGPQPAAKNMPNLTWDDELEFLAQRWADQCNWGYDKCRDVERFKVAQNIGLITTPSNVYTVNLAFMINYWYNQVQFYNKNEISKYEGNVRRTWFYTRMIWATTTKIGCGLTKYMIGAKNAYYIVCNYGPRGNNVGLPVYEPKSKF